LFCLIEYIPYIAPTAENAQFAAHFPSTLTLGSTFLSIQFKDGGGFGESAILPVHFVVIALKDFSWRLLKLPN
jgi:hypothetical protein